MSASAIVWNELKNMSILLVGRYSSSDNYRQSWFPVLWICLICPSGPTAGWHFVLLFYIDTASKVKKWQMWHLRCCQVTVQSWGKLDFDWLLVTTVKNKIDLLAVTDDDERPVAEVDICGSWRRLGFLVHNSWFYFVVISSFVSCCHFVLPAHLCPSPTPVSHQHHQHRLVPSVSPPALYCNSFVFYAGVVPPALVLPSCFCFSSPVPVSRSCLFPELLICSSCLSGSSSVLFFWMLDIGSLSDFLFPTCRPLCVPFLFAFLLCKVRQFGLKCRGSCSPEDELCTLWWF